MSKPVVITNNDGNRRIVRLRHIAVILIGMFVGISLLPPDLTLLMVIENGPVEMLSAIGLFAASCWLFSRAGRDTPGRPISAGILVLLLALRELDFHSRFTTMGIFKTKYYLSSAVPTGEKTIVSFLMVIIVIVAVRFLVYNFGPFVSALRRRDPGALAVLSAIGYGLLGKGLDSLSTPLERPIAFFSANPKLILRTAEEIAELGVPCSILLALYYSSFLSRDASP